MRPMWRGDVRMSTVIVANASLASMPAFGETQIKPRRPIYAQVNSRLHDSAKHFDEATCDGSKHEEHTISGCLLVIRRSRREPSVRRRIGGVHTCVLARSRCSS